MAYKCTASKLIPLLLILFSGSNLLFAQKDTLVMTNHEILIGEIETLQKGVLVVETDYSDKDFQVEWDKVAKIYSSNIFLITLANKTRLVGTIKTDPADTSKVIIHESGTDVSCLLTDVLFMKAYDSEFIDRLDVDIGFGLNLAKTNNLRQFTTRSNLGYIGKIWSTDASLEAIRSIQDSVDATRRTSASIGGRVIFQKNWLAFLSANFLQSDELNLKLRSIAEGGPGYQIVATNKMYFMAGTGLAWNNEQFTDDQPNRNSLEGLVAMELNLFDIEDFSLLTGIAVYPGITEKGRIRTDFKIDLSYDLPYDFYIKLGFTHNFDNQPAENTSGLDYSFTTTFGWEL